jgi:hypothetical protein
MRHERDDAAVVRTTELFTLAKVVALGPDDSVHHERHGQRQGAVVSLVGP